MILKYEITTENGQSLRLISVDENCQLLHANTTNFTEQELGLVLVRALNVRCVESDAGRIETGLLGVASAINGIELPLQQQERPPEFLLE